MRNRLELSSLIKHVADDLRRTAKQTDNRGEPYVMAFSECEVSAAFEVDLDVNGKVNLYAVEAGAAGKQRTAHTVKVKFRAFNEQEVADDPNRLIPITAAVANKQENGLRSDDPLLLISSMVKDVPASGGAYAIYEIPYSGTSVSLRAHSPSWARVPEKITAHATGVIEKLREELAHDAWTRQITDWSLRITATWEPDIHLFLVIATPQSKIEQREITSLDTKPVYAFDLREENR